MGHNDQKEKGEGVGAFTTYSANLKKFVAAAREHGATPVLITSMNRLTFDAEGKITNSLGDFPEAVRRVAKEENVALIDLNAMSKPFYEAMGPSEAHQAFAGKDTTHHSNYGSYELGISLFTILALAGALPTVFVAGDSTANNTNHKGWGDPVAGIKAWFGLRVSSFLN